MNNLDSMRPDICVTRSNGKVNETKWFSANQDYDELYEEIAEFVGKSELSSDDFQVIAMDDFGKWEPNKSQSNDLHLIAGVGQAIAEYGYAFSVYITDVEKITEWDDQIVENFESAFFGEFTSMREFVDNYLDVYCIEDTLNTPFLLGTLSNYLDYEDIQIDLENQYQVIKAYSPVPELDGFSILSAIYVFGDE